MKESLKKLFQTELIWYSAVANATMCILFGQRLRAILYKPRDVNMK